MDGRMSGVLNLVSVGPGFNDLIVPRAEAALRDSSVIVAYELYLRWIEPWLAGKEIHTPPLTQERERALLAIDKARSGATVALISSGDIGIYAMAALAFRRNAGRRYLRGQCGARDYLGQCVRVIAGLAVVA